MFRGELPIYFSPDDPSGGSDADNFGNPSHSLNEAERAQREREGQILVQSETIQLHERLRVLTEQFHQETPSAQEIAEASGDPVLMGTLERDEIEARRAARYFRQGQNTDAPDLLTNLILEEVNNSGLLQLKDTDGRPLTSVVVSKTVPEMDYTKGADGYLIIIDNETSERMFLGFDDSTRKPIIRFPGGGTEINPAWEDKLSHQKKYFDGD
ncbi:MAG: hypothetical protein V1826_02215, partial [bacterium]